MPLLSIFIIHAFALMTPGPDFMFMCRTGTRHRGHHILQAALGLTSGVAIWATLSLVGLNLLFRAYPWARVTVMIVGALYLYRIAYAIYRSANEVHFGTTGKDHRFFVKGLATNLSNPKAIVYFSSIFSTLHLQKGSFILPLVILLVVIETAIWFILLGYLFSSSSVKLYYQRHKKRFDHLSAAVFFVFATLILAEAFFVIHTR
jgi:threonine efflux protein